MNNHFLESTNEENDVGVIVEVSLKFHRHTAVAVKKANSVLGVFKKRLTTVMQVNGKTSHRIRERNMGSILQR